MTKAIIDSRQRPWKSSRRSDEGCNGRLKVIIAAEYPFSAPTADKWPRSLHLVVRRLGALEDAGCPSPSITYGASGDQPQDIVCHYCKWPEF